MAGRAPFSRRLASLALLLAVCLQLAGEARAAPALPTDAATAENVLEVLSQYDAGAYHILKTEYDGGGDFLAWFFGGLLITQMDTAVHETYHAYTAHQSASPREDAIYLGGGADYPVDHSAAYERGFTRTEEMSRQIPDALRTCRYGEYVAPGSRMAANTLGVFGMLNEFTAYYWGLRTMNSLAQFLIDTDCGIDGWRAYLVSIGNNMTAYAEFKYWTLRYMLYIRRANPALYRAILDNEAYCGAYREAETKFAAEIARSREIAAGSAARPQGKGFSIQWSDAAICLVSDGYKNGVSLADYGLLAAELEKAEYVEMDAILKDPGSAPSPGEASSQWELVVNGAPVRCRRYRIDGGSCFRLRDIAYLLRDTAARFSVVWDAPSRTVSVLSGQDYEADGSELALGEGDLSGAAAGSRQTILVNGKTVPGLRVYEIGGSNYVNLRDLAAALGFQADYLPETDTDVIVC